MKILLIKPSMGSIINNYKINDGRMEPLQLGIIASCLPEHWDITLLDERMESLPSDIHADVVFITIDSFTARNSYHIADTFRNRNITVILGGVHVSLLPVEAITHADSIVVGDIESIASELVLDIEKNTLKNKYTGTFGIPQNGIYPKRSLFKGKGYLPISLVQFSRGCVYNCTYCSVAKFFNSSHHCRPVHDVIEEIERNKFKRILFVDDNMIIHKKKAKELFKALIPLKIKWASQASIDMIQDPEMLDLMAKSGCIGHLIGFESIDINSLKLLNKRPNTRNFDSYQKCISILRSYGFQTWASFIIGNDTDTKDSIKRTVEFAIKSKFTLSFFHIFMPYPGTAVYEQFRKEKRLLFNSSWWNHPEFTYNAATFIPKNMSPEELSEAAINANKEFYSNKSIITRLFDFKTNLRSLEKFLFYLQFNMIIKNTSV